MGDVGGRGSGGWGRCGRAWGTRLGSFAPLPTAPVHPTLRQGLPSFRGGLSSSPSLRRAPRTPFALHTHFTHPPPRLSPPGRHALELPGEGASGKGGSSPCPSAAPREGPRLSAGRGRSGPLENRAHLPRELTGLFRRKGVLGVQRPTSGSGFRPALCFISRERRAQKVGVSRLGSPACARASPGPRGVARCGLAADGASLAAGPRRGLLSARTRGARSAGAGAEGEAGPRSSTRGRAGRCGSSLARCGSNLRRSPARRLTCGSHPPAHGAGRPLRGRSPQRHARPPPRQPPLRPSRRPVERDSRSRPGRSRWVRRNRGVGTRGAI